MPRYSANIALDYETLTRKTFHRLHDGGWAYETQQNIEPILDANKAAQNDVPAELKSIGAKRVASIPLVFIQMLWDKHGVDYWSPDPDVQAWIDRWLDEPAQKWLRTDNTVLSKRRVSKAQIERRLAERKLWASL